MSYEKFALEKIGEAIKLIMDDRKININKLEKASGVSRTIIYKILKGENYEMTGFIRVCRGLQVHLEISALDIDNNVWNDIGKPSDN